MPMSPEEKASRLKVLLRNVAPQDSLESLVRDPLHSHEALESLDEGFVAEGTHLANEGLRNLERNAQPTDEQLDALEAIVLPRERPAVFIVDDDFQAPPEPWTHFNSGAIHDRIKKAIPSIGRIELPGMPQIPYGGTGFIVGENLLMTNRHVAELFTSGLGLKGLDFKPGQSAGWDSKQEYQRASSRSSFVAVKKVLMIHPYWDMALLQTDGFPDGHPVLQLSVSSPESLLEHEVAVIGYPAKDWRNNTQLQDQIFQNTYNVKRLQPGKIQKRENIDSFAHTVNAVTHDSSTLGGNSGSAVIDVATGHVVALHFAGIYLKANYAVPTAELARDQRVVDAGLNFVAAVARDGTWNSSWDDLDTEKMAPIFSAPKTTGSDRPAITLQNPPASRPTVISAARCGPQGTVEYSGSLQITVNFGAENPSVVGTEAIPDQSLEKVDINPDYSNREGYDPKFFGTRKVVPVPQLTTARQKRIAVANDTGAEGMSGYEFAYHHYSLVMNGERRLAFFTAVNIDGSQTKRPKREPDRWIFDPRLPVEMQIGNDFYGKPFDRGHLVRRIDPAWGRSAAIIKEANDDTFHFTNCSPQHSRFNEGKNLWAGLEDFILDTADNEETKVTVFTGPIFGDDDPVYLDVPIPREFWKVMVFVKPDGKLSASGFIVSQNDLLKAENIESPADVAQTYQVAVSTVAQRTKLDFGDLPSFDRFGQTETTEAIAAQRPLVTYEQIVL